MALDPAISNSTLSLHIGGLGQGGNSNQESLGYQTPELEKKRQHLGNGLCPSCLGEGRWGPALRRRGRGRWTLQRWGGPAGPRKGAGRPQ
jgi:hypothetical protein